MHTARLVLITAFFVVFVFGTVSAQTTEFSYQGSLKDGANPATGNYDFEFALFDSLSAGTQIGSTLTRNTVAVAGGTFAVKLDFGSQFPGANRFLEVRVRLTGQPGITILAPRQQLNSSPYSVKSLNSDNAINATNATSALTAVTATDATQLGGQTPSFYQNAANLNSGTLASARLPTPLSVTGAGFGNGIISGTNSSNSGMGVKGLVTAGTTITFGGYFQSDSTSGRGVHGFASSDTGVTYGVSGESDSTSGIGVFGRVSVATGTTYGGRFESNSTSGRGVYGYASSDTGTTYGVLGSSASPDGYGGYFSGRGYFSGNVGLGVIDPTFRLQLSTNSAAKPTSSSWTISSDRRLKKNIRTIDGALDQLMQLRGVTYQWKDPASQGDMAGTYTGMIAQDVEKVFPEWIRDDANGYKTLTVIGFEGIVVEALRQLRAEKNEEIGGQQNQISSQQAQIEEQRKLIETQQRQIDSLKKFICLTNKDADLCKE